MKTTRLIIVGTGQCALQDAPLDEALRAGEVLVRTRCALLCDGPALSAFRGPTPLPCPVSSALVGEVVAGGTLPAGTRVACHGLVSSHVKIRAIECAVLPDDLNDETAGFFAAAQEALASVRVAPPRLGENVVVLGQGVPGNLMAQLYRLSGAGLVSVAARGTARLAIAQQCGIEKCLTVSERPLAEWLRELAPRGAELLCVAGEGLDLLPEALPFVAPHGIVTLQAVPAETVARQLWGLVIERSLAVLGAPGARIADAQRAADAPMLLDWLATGRLWTEPLCTQKMPLAQAQDALTGLRDKPDEFLGVLLSLDS